MSFTDKINNHNMGKINGRLEELTRKQVVLTPEGLYKLSGVKRDNNSLHYILQFTKFRSTQNEKLEFKVTTDYKLSYLSEIDSFSILDDLDTDSYNDGKHTQKLEIDIGGCSKKANDYALYFKEFLINYAKLEQNEANEARKIDKRYDCNFSILKNKNSLDYLL